MAASGLANFFVLMYRENSVKHILALIEASLLLARSKTVCDEASCEMTASIIMLSMSPWLYGAPNQNTWPYQPKFCRTLHE